VHRLQRAGPPAGSELCRCVLPNDERTVADEGCLAEAYGNLGNALKELGDLDGAVRFYLKVRAC
jgi:hypothetical protein